MFCMEIPIHAFSILRIINSLLWDPLTNRKMKVLISVVWSYYNLKNTHMLYNMCLDFGLGNCLSCSELLFLKQGTLRHTVYKLKSS